MKNSRGFGRAAIMAIVICGVVGIEAAAAQTLPLVVLPDGALDPRFGTGGIATTVGSVAALQPDGKIVVAGSGFGPTSLRQDFLLLRLNANGTSDGGFGTNGIVHTDFGGRIDRATALLRLQDGEIVAGGSIGSNRIDTPSDFGLARYSENGTSRGVVRT